MQIKKGTIGDDGFPVIDEKRYLTMGGSLYLDGNVVGRFHSTKDMNYVLVLNGWPDYKKFAEAIGKSDVQLFVGADTIIEVPFRDFEDHYLSKLEAVHTDPISFFIREAEFPGGERVPEHVLKEFRKTGETSRKIIMFPERR